jgi:hypothetical protein
MKNQPQLRQVSLLEPVEEAPYQSRNNVPIFKLIPEPQVKTSRENIMSIIEFNPANA